MNNRKENQPHRNDADLLLEEAETLIWDLLDDEMDDQAIGRFTQLLEESPAVRARYIDCVQLHVDLQDHFGRKSAQESGASTEAVVLQHLPGLVGLPGFPRVVE